MSGSLLRLTAKLSSPRLLMDASGPSLKERILIMRVAYHEDVDILTIVFKSKDVKVSEEVLPGVIVDFDHDGQITAFEIMDASKFTDFSQVQVFMSQWGNENRILDADGGFSVQPKTAKAVSAGG